MKDLLSIKCLHWLARHISRLFFFQKCQQTSTQLPANIKQTSTHLQVYSLRCVRVDVILFSNNRL